MILNCAHKTMSPRPVGTRVAQNAGGQVGQPGLRNARAGAQGVVGGWRRTAAQPFTPCSKPVGLTSLRLPKRHVPHVAVTESATTDAPAKTASTKPAPQEDSNGGTSVWTHQWWPLVPVGYLDPNRPKAMTVMGVPLVVWKDGEGQWRAFKDACPHRLAPLSEGRVESDGTLLCSYHAWRFDGEGKCTTIPQSISPEAEANAKASKRSCAVSFPLQERAGLLWVWPDEAETRWVDAAAAAVPVPTRAEEDLAEKGKLDWFMRDLPYGFEALAENLMDPSHLPVSHHKNMATWNRYKLHPLEFEPLKDKEIRESFPSSLALTPVPAALTYKHTSPTGADKTIYHHFVAPGLFQDTDHAMYAIQLYGVPVNPGKSRLFMLIQFRLPPLGPNTNLIDVAKQSLIRFAIESRSVADNHKGNLALFDGDAVFLNMQEGTLYQGYNGDWRKSFFMPSPCDLPVVAIRKWLDQQGPIFPDRPIPQTAPIERRVLLDRYAQHTAHCPTCQAEVRRLEAAAAGLKVLAAAACLAACALAGSAGWQGLLQHSAPFLTAAGAAVGALLAGAALALTKGLDKLRADRQQFFFTDYVHANIH